MRRFWTWLLVAPVLLAGPAPAQAELVELVGGRTVQGEVVVGQTTDDALALEMFDTGGVISIKWDHIIPARAKDLKRLCGLGETEETEYLVPGHRVLLNTSNKVVEGRALNPDEKDKPLLLKTRSSVTPYERSAIARIDETMLPGLLLYTPNELYDMRRDENPPDSSAANLAMTRFCMQIGALDRAKEHLEAAKTDQAFVETTEGRQIPTIERQLDLLIKSKGAQDMVTQIKGSIRANRWNEALELFNKLDKDFTDETVRSLIKFSFLETQVVNGRNRWFEKTVQSSVYKAMRSLIEAKARERKPLRDDPDRPRGVATPGTLASARQWASRDLPKLMKAKVMADLDLKDEEFDEFFKKRSGKNIQTASYGTGTFIVVKKAPTARGPSGPRPSGPPRGAQQGGPPRQTTESKPKTEEEWWELLADRASDRAKWLTAYFVESSGIFEIIRTDETEACGPCGGRGVNVTSNADGTSSQTVCTACNGAAKIKKVLYR